MVAGASGKCRAPAFNLHNAEVVTLFEAGALADSFKNRYKAE
jgi:hypothetical protein